MTRFKKMSFVVMTASYLSGCSMIQDWFPDKEKDYQFTTELPPLIIPPDLAQKPKLQTHAAPAEMVKPKIEKAIESAKTAVSTHAEKIAKVEQVVATQVEAVAIQRPALSNAQTEIPKNEIQISLTHENIPSLNLNVPTARTWRIVSKALSRSGIEVTKHDLETGQITVQVYEKSEKPTPKEDSFFSGAGSVFSGFVNDEQRYVLQFQESGEKTSVTVLDADLQPLKNAASEQLLSTLFDSIKTDLSK